MSMNRRDLVGIFRFVIKWIPDISTRACFVCDLSDYLYGLSSENADERRCFYETWEDVKGEYREA